MTIQIKGRVYMVGDAIQKTEKFKGRDLIVEIDADEKYPQLIKVEAANDKCDMLNSINAGDEVEVDCNLNGRKWTNKEGVDQFFNSLGLWKVKVLTAAPAPVTASPEPEDKLPF